MFLCAQYPESTLVAPYMYRHTQQIAIRIQRLHVPILDSSHAPLPCLRHVFDAAQCGNQSHYLTLSSLLFPSSEVFVGRTLVPSYFSLVEHGKGH